MSSGREGWLASEDVIRLIPNTGVSPGGLWLATSTAQVQAQLRALTFGSVVDHLAAEDVEQILLPAVPSQLAERAAQAWEDFDEAELLGRRVREELEASLVV